MSLLQSQTILKSRFFYKINSEHQLHRWRDLEIEGAVEQATFACLHLVKDILREFTNVWQTSIDKPKTRVWRRAPHVSQFAKFADSLKPLGCLFGLSQASARVDVYQHFPSHFLMKSPHFMLLVQNQQSLQIKKSKLMASQPIGDSILLIPTLQIYAIVLE